MKTLLTSICLLALSGVLLAQQVQPNARVQAAFSASEITSMTYDQVFRLNTQADKLCWFEQIKSESSATEVFTLVTKSGKTAQLSSADLENFNPLLYTLPQSQNRCENLVIQCTDGSKHLLIVRSYEMMLKEYERAAVRQNR
ncbi:MAG: hypothetical protein ACKO66_09195, partial [Flavobacteriales bacterium]